LPAQNPFRSEAAAYRFLLLTIAYFAAIVVAAAINRWLALATFLALTAAGAWWLLSRGERAKPERVRSRDSDVRRILVVANETVGGEELLDAIRERSAGVNEEVLVVSPTLTSRVQHWTSDQDRARAAAEQRLERSLAALREAGIDASGQVTDDDPVQAIEDALRVFGADEVIISTHPPGRSNWIEQNVVARARERCDCPIRHVVVDLAAEPARTP
jgi:GABA permease